MNDLISRQAAIEAIEEYEDRLQIVNWVENPGVPYKVHALNWAANTIRDLPSAEPEIIRCEDCKWHMDNFCGNFNVIGFKDDGYCSFAKRSEHER